MSLISKSGISRRGFLGGGMAAAAATLLSACRGKKDKDDESKGATGEPQVLTDDSKIIDALDEYESVDTTLTAAYTWNLPVGTVPFYSQGSFFRVSCHASVQAGFGRGLRVLRRACGHGGVLLGRDQLLFVCLVFVCSGFCRGPGLWRSAKDRPRQRRLGAPDVFAVWRVRNLAKDAQFLWIEEHVFQ